MLKLSSNGNLALTSSKSGSEQMRAIVPAKKVSDGSITFNVSDAAPQFAAAGEAETFSHSINEQLQAYEVGCKLRRLRLKKGMALSTLGKVSELSPSMICKLERGKSLPTLPTLLRLSHALGVELRFFFNKSHQANVSTVRRNERLRFRNVPHSGYSYAFESLNFRAQVDTSTSFGLSSGQRLRLPNRTSTTEWSSCTCSKASWPSGLDHKSIGLERAIQSISNPKSSTAIDESEQARAKRSLWFHLPQTIQTESK